MNISLQFVALEKGMIGFLATENKQPSVLFVYRSDLSHFQADVDHHTDPGQVPGLIRSPSEQYLGDSASPV